MTDHSNADPWRRFRGGDPEAFAELVRTYQGALLRHARGLLGPGSEYEDVVQETFLRLAQSPPGITGDGADAAQLAAWLHKVTRNLCMDVMRSETRRRRRERDSAEPEATGGGMGTVEAADTRAVVEQKLQELPPDQREVLVLRLLGEKSYREIAEITGKKVGTVGWLISVGMKALSNELAPLFGVVREKNSNRTAVADSGMGFGLMQGEA